VAGEPEKKRKNRAQKQAGDDRKVERGVLAAVDDVTGKAAEFEGEPCAEVQKSTDEDEENS